VIAAITCTHSIERSGRTLSYAAAHHVFDPNRKR
jgi:hypothetical protein